eukprot:TRINITY_DN5580_c0_g2_i1.p1 TRINITY_DN5580_c0_g2~~TRINITY_DN5580_c0_g2_i1.p1  ORF type:complete len:2809 (+),score=612.65 TRINITY_DN5580_c0_g2_i1:1924-10350(+)
MTFTSTINGDLVAESAVSIQGSSNVGGISVTGLLSTQDVSITGPVRVGSGFFANNLFVGDTVRVGNSTVSDLVDLRANVVVNLGSSVGNVLVVSGSASLTGDVSVEGSLFAGRLTTAEFAAIGDVSVRGDVFGQQVTSTTLLSDNLSASNLSVAATLSVSESVTATGTLNVGCDGAFFEGPITVANQVSASSLSVNGSEFIAGSLSVGGDASLGDVVVESDAVFGIILADGVTGDENTRFANITINGPANLTSLTANNVETDSFTSTTTTVRTANVEGDANLGSNAFLGSGVQVQTTTTFSESLGIEGNLAVTRQTNITGDVVVTGTFGVAGQLELQGSVISFVDATIVDVTNASIVTASVTRTDNLAAANLSTNLLTSTGGGIIADFDVAGTLAAGTTTVFGTLEVNSLSVVGQFVTPNFALEQLSVSQNAFIGQLNLVDASISVKAPLYIRDDFSIEGSASVGDLSVGSYETGAFTVEGDTSIRGLLEIGGSVFLGCDQSSANGTLFVAGDANIAGNARVGQEIVANGPSFSSGNVEAESGLFQGSVNATQFTAQSAAINGVFNAESFTTRGSLSAETLSVEGTSSVSGDLFGFDLTTTNLTTGDVAIAGDLTAETLSVAQEASVGGNVTVTSAFSTANIQVSNLLVAFGGATAPTITVEGSTGSTSNLVANNFVGSTVYASETNSDDLSTNELTVSSSASVGSFFVRSTYVTDSATFGSGLDVTRDLTLRQFNAESLIANSLSVDGPLNAGGSTSVAGDVDVTSLDGLSFGSDLAVNGNANLFALSSDSTLNTNCLSVGGDAQFASILNLADTSAGSFASTTLFVNGTGDSSVSGVAFIQNLRSGSLSSEATSVSGNALLNNVAFAGVLYVSGDNTNTGAINATNSVSTTGEVNANNLDAANAQLYGNLDVLGNVALGCGTNSVTQINSELAVGESLATSGDANIQGSLAAGSLSVGTLAMNRLFAGDSNVNTATAVSLVVGGDLSAGNLTVPNGLNAGVADINSLSVSSLLSVESLVVSSLSATESVSISGDLSVSGPVSSSGSLSVSGQLSVSAPASVGELSVDGALAANSLDVLTGVSIGGDLETQRLNSESITAENEFNATLLRSSEFSAEGDLFVQNGANIFGNLVGSVSVTGTATFNNDLSVTSVGTVGGETSVDNLQVNGDLANAGDVVSTRSLFVDGVSTIQGEASAPALDVTGTLTVSTEMTTAALSISVFTAEAVSVSNAAELSSVQTASLVANGPLDVGSALTQVLSAEGSGIFGSISANSISADQVTGPNAVLSISNSLNASSISAGSVRSSDLTAATLTVSEDVNLAGGLSVTGDAIIGCGGTVSATEPIVVNGDADLSDFTVDGTLTVSGSVTGARSVSFNNLIAGASNVEDSAEIASSLILSGDAVVNGTYSVAGNAFAAAFASDNLNTQTARISGSASADSSTVSGRASFGSSLIVEDNFSAGAVTSGTVTIAEELSADSANLEDAIVSDTTNVTRDVYIEGTLRVLGSTDVPVSSAFNNINTSIGSIDSLRVNNGSFIAGSLTVGGDADLGCVGNVAVGGPIVFDGPGNMEGETTVLGDLTVVPAGGSGVFVDRTSSLSELSVATTSLILGDLTVQSLSSIAGSFTANGDFTVGGSLVTENEISPLGFLSTRNVRAGTIYTAPGDVTGDTVNATSLVAVGDLATGGNVNVQGPTRVGGNAEINRNLIVQESGEISGDLTFTSALSDVAANIISAENLDVAVEFSVEGPALFGLTGLTPPVSLSVTNEINVEGSAQVSGGVTVTGSLSVREATTILGDVSIAGASALIAQGSVSVDKGISVAADTQIAGALVVGRELSVNGVTLVLNDASVSGQYSTGSATISGSLLLSQGISVSGPVSIGENSTSTPTGFTANAASLNALAETNFDGSFGTSDDLNVRRNFTSLSTGFVRGDLTTQGDIATNFYEVDSDTSIDSDLFLAGSMNLGNDLEVSGSVFTSSICVLGTTSLDGDVFVSGDVFTPGILNVAGSATTDSEFSVTGDASVFADTNVGGAANFAGNLNNIRSATFNGDATVTGSFSAGGTINAEGSASLNSDLSVSGASESQNDFTVNGASTVDTLGIGSTTTIVGAYSSEGSALIGGNLFVDGALFNGESSLVIGTEADINTPPSTIGGFLTVSGEAFLNFGLDVAGDANLGGSLSVGGSADLGGTLQVLNVFAEFNLASGNSLTTSGVLSVGGTATLAQFGGVVILGDDPTTVSGSVSASEASINSITLSTLTPGDASIGDLTVTGILTTSGNLQALGANTVNGDLNIVTGGATVSGPLTTAGDTFITSDVTVGGSLTQLEPTRVAGSVDLAGSLSIAGNSFVQRDARFNDGLSVGGMTMRRDISTTGKRSNLQTVVFEGELSVQEGLSLEASATVSDNLVIAGDARISSPLTAASTQLGSLFVSSDVHSSVAGPLNGSMSVSKGASFSSLSSAGTFSAAQISIDTLSAKSLAGASINVSELNATKNAVVSGELSVSKNLVVTRNVVLADTSVAGQMNLESMARVGVFSAQNVEVAETMTVSKAVHLPGALIAQGPASMDSLSTSSLVASSASLNHVVFEQDLSVQGKLSVSKIVANGLITAANTTGFKTGFESNSLTVQDAAVEEANISGFLRTQKLSFPYAGIDASGKVTPSSSYSSYVVHFAPETDSSEVKMYSIALSGYTLNFLEPGKTVVGVHRFETVSYGPTGSDVVYRYEIGDIILVKGSSELKKVVNLWDFEDVMTTGGATNGNLYMGRGLATESLSLYTEALNSDEIAMFMYSPRSSVGANGRSQDTPVEWVKIL